ncbi:MAG: hypothetical protein KGJ58_04075 [Patescibacteria group bacterium]|nr:hypothetical protein [Patescibacteria group bacterium]MDE1988434.1 hypothetical protein [Patescibacteria group bacterium]MDE2218599.1 hypothetical protein [Patescibacteria group bacterium]
MKLGRLCQILRETTAQLRKGEEIEGDPKLVDAVNFKEGDNLDKLPGGSHIYAMPHESQAKDGIEKVDLHFIVVGVDKAKAEQYKDELVAILKTYPQPERLAGGLSYIEVGGEIGDQGAVFQLFALGKVLGLWDVITPEKLGITGPEANQMAGMGFVMMSGFKAA